MDQFTKQAVPFANVLAHSNQESINLLIKSSQMNKGDDVLDVACGPGLLACAVAPFVQKVTGIDLVPSMIKKVLSQMRNIKKIKCLGKGKSAKWARM